MTISPKGEMISHEITESVICVDKRMSYNKVSAVLEQDEQALREYEGFVPMIWMMKELSELIRQKRGKRGAIDFDFPETKIVLDEDGKPIEVKPYDRNPATEIIEDFMLMANETVAEEFSGGRFRFFTGRMKRRMRTGSDSFRHLSTASAIISMSEMRSGRKRFRNCLRK